VTGERAIEQHDLRRERRERTAARVVDTAISVRKVRADHCASQSGAQLDRALLLFSQMLRPRVAQHDVEQRAADIFAEVYPNRARFEFPGSC